MRDLHAGHVVVRCDAGLDPDDDEFCLVKRILGKAALLSAILFGAGGPFLDVHQ